MKYKLGLLDQSPVIEGASNFETLQRTVQLAQQAEAWGYERFWVSEHHHSNTVAGSSPEVLVSYLLAKTKKIRIGTGGVMLQHYSPYKVAENFHVMSTLEPGRVDLGVGKTPGGLPLATKALQYKSQNLTGDDFEPRLHFLKQLIQNTIPETDEFAGLEATPIPPVEPEIYLLGAGSNTAKLAADLEISFAFARFINSDDMILKEAAKLFKERHPNGKLIVAVSVIAAPSEAEAKKLASDQKIVKVHLASGRTLSLQTEEQANKFGKESGEAYEVKTYDANIIYGNPSQIISELDQLHNEYDVDEFILHTPIPNTKQRLQSFELLSPLNTINYTVQS